ncbi:uncharacterized protein BJ171DRAFT_10489 [Polychytrium aggregatum]|uniref:uncharacterized protein n=1 Tax=Polychytrium aggregatum TaxID=110093 RepID=UPI0022FF2408|nr:uncharacterized protein BJ171DRAFT_10489 [Polychytrium aggregatum]KAI9209899.1 hypothetical protein BJ171DRAFT_10489 [Polychytrium aggregatum]
MTATALISKNGVQVISLGIYSIGEAAFSIIQFFQSRFYTYQDSTNTIVFHDKLASSAGYTSFCQFSEIAVVALTTALTVFLWAMTIYLYNEINWVLYNRMGPSLLKKRYFYLYQVFLSVVKFNAFFLVIYGAQITGAFVLNAYLVANFGEHLLAVLLGVSIPLLLITITMGFAAVNYESFVALCVFEVGCIGTIAGIIFVIIRTYNSQSNGSSFAIMRVFLLFFSILSLLLTLAAGIIGILIRQSFGMGLSKHLFNPLKRNEHEADEKDNSDIVLE